MSILNGSQWCCCITPQLGDATTGQFGSQRQVGRFGLVVRGYVEEPAVGQHPEPDPTRAEPTRSATASTTYSVTAMRPAMVAPV